MPDLVPASGDIDARIDDAVLASLEQCGDIVRRSEIVADELGRVHINRKVAEPVRPLAPVQSEIKAANILRLKIDILVLHVSHATDGIEVGPLHGRDILSVRRVAHDVRIARALHPQDIVEDKGVALAKDPDDALLLHRPVVCGEGEPAPGFRHELRLIHQASRPGFRFFRLQIGIAGALRRRHVGP
ncbi:hypothetical protein D3C80_1394170 [compost metagenome]